jgi:hypothetical protein
MTTESHGIAMPYGNVADPLEEGPTVPGGTRVHARIAESAITQRARHAVDVTRKDLADSWVLRGGPPPLGDLIAERRDTDVPGDHNLLRAARLGFNYFRIGWSALFYALAWVGQEPVRMLAAILATGAFIGLITAAVNIII